MTEIGNPLMEAYLNQQLNQQEDFGDGSGGNANAAEIPNSEDLIKFKGLVHKWLELDEQIKGFKDVLREKIANKKEFTENILEFMSRYNIEDLNTGRGKLRLKMAVVKEPLSQQTIKEKVSLYFNEVQGGDDLNKKIFTERKTFTKPTLKRLAGKKAPLSLTAPPPQPVESQ